MPTSDHPEWLYGINNQPFSNYTYSTAANTTNVLNAGGAIYAEEMKLRRRALQQQIELQQQELGMRAVQQESARKKTEVEMLRDRVEEVCALGRWL